MYLNMRILIFIGLLVLSNSGYSQTESFSFSAKISHVYASGTLIKDIAIRSAFKDFSTGTDLSKDTSISLSDSREMGKAKTACILLLLPEDKLSLRPDSLDHMPEEAYFVKKRVLKGRSFLFLTGGSIKAVCYGMYFLRERMILGDTVFFAGNSLYREPEFKFRMITQPFEVPGFAAVAHLGKPVICERQFDPMRPFDGAGYSAEDEARNILRSGLNTMYIGSYTFATTYRSLSKDIFPDGSEGRKWVEERRARFKELIGAAKKYHLKVCVNSDVFAYPKSVNIADKWKALECSLNETLTDFPEIDYVVGRFGENYTYFNPYFTGHGPEFDQELPKLIDFIHAIVSGKYHKVFIPRTWSMGNDSWHADPKLYQQTISKVSADKDIFFSIKNTQTDFWRYNRFNPSLGTGVKKQAIEYLCQDGYHFKSAIPNYEVIRMASGSKEIDAVPTGLKKAKALGVTFTWGWLSADGWCGPYLKREEWLGANIYGYTHLMWDVNADPHEMAKDWAALEFKVKKNSNAANAIADILMLSEEMILKACYFKDFSKKHNGWLPSLNWQRDDVLGGGSKSYKNERCATSVNPGTIRPIFNSTTINEDCADKQRALELAELMLQKFEAIRPELPDAEQAVQVRNTLLSSRYLMAVINYYINGMFRYYNGENKVALEQLRNWKESWQYYNNVVAKMPGAPTPMIDGGMVETCNLTLDKLTNSFTGGK